MILDRKNGAKEVLLRGAPMAALMGATLLLSGCAGLMIAGAAGSMGAAGGLAASQPANLETTADGGAGKETGEAGRSSTTATDSTAAASAPSDLYQPGTTGALRADEISAQPLPPN